MTARWRDGYDLVTGGTFMILAEAALTGVKLWKRIWHPATSCLRHLLFRCTCVAVLRCRFVSEPSLIRNMVSIVSGHQTKRE